MMTQDQLIRNINNYVTPTMTKMLRRSYNHAIRVSRTPIEEYERMLMTDMIEQEADDFSMVLMKALLYLNEEDICDFLDSMKHLIIGKQ